jgi:hypothetical protein
MTSSTFSYHDLTVRDLTLLEDRLGDDWQRKIGSGSATAMQCIALIVLRRERPDMTWDDAGMVKLSVLDDVMATIGESGSADPPTATD